MRETVTVDNSVLSLTASSYKPTSGLFAAREAVGALISVEAASIRMTLDGTDPVAATTGHLLETGTIVTLTGFNTLRQAKFTREAGASGTLQVTYYF
jgi:hypothetical protein